MKPGDKVWLIYEAWCRVGEIVSGSISSIDGNEEYRWKRGCGAFRFSKESSLGSS